MMWVSHRLRSAILRECVIGRVGGGDCAIGWEGSGAGSGCTIGQAGGGSSHVTGREVV